MASNKFRSKKDIVYDQLREDIVKGVHKPGARLVIDELAKEMTASQIPIREAIQQLEADGFITTEPYVGARVAEIDAAFIYEVFALLESMEIICSRSACAVMTDEELEELSQMVMEMDDLLDKPLQWSERNKAMHLFICECAQTTLILKMVQKVFDHWERLRLYYLPDIAMKRIQEAQSEHHQILKAMQDRDPDTAEEILRNHNRSALKSYTRHLKKIGYLN